ncbi:hypothetical protein Fmac_018604 [Flemingia macrophylla]|uniref:Uncharacterized protein n=1 Tax=Flemingia macrophylla TaxID=520843 RepID=A0ABD1M648_9FABA
MCVRQSVPSFEDDVIVSQLAEALSACGFMWIVCMRKIEILRYKGMVRRTLAEERNAQSWFGEPLDEETHDEGKRRSSIFSSFIFPSMPPFPFSLYDTNPPLPFSLYGTNPLPFFSLRCPATHTGTTSPSTASSPPPPTSRNTLVSRQHPWRQPHGTLLRAASAASPLGFSPTLAPSRPRPSSSSLAPSTSPFTDWSEGHDSYWNRRISACVVCDGASPIFQNKLLAKVNGGGENKKVIGGLKIVYAKSCAPALCARCSSKCLRELVVKSSCWLIFLRLLWPLGFALHV